MKTKTLKVVTTLLMALFVVCSISQVAFAGANTGAGSSGSSWDITPTPVDGSTIGSLKTTAGKILGLIQAASGVAAVVLIAVFGFKFIMGSATEKVDYQKSFIPLIVGVVVVFAATGVANLLFSTFANQ